MMFMSGHGPWRQVAAFHGSAGEHPSSDAALLSKDAAAFGANWSCGSMRECRVTCCFACRRCTPVVSVWRIMKCVSELHCQLEAVG